MYIKVERNSFNDFFENAWSGACDVLREVAAQDREDEAVNIITEYMGMDGESIPTDTQVNDFIWFELSDIMDLYNEETEEDEEE